MITVLLAYLTACLLAAGICWLALAAIRCLNWVTRRYAVVSWNNNLPCPARNAPAWSWA